MRKEFDRTEFFDVNILITFFLLVVCDIIAKVIRHIGLEKTDDSPELTKDYRRLADKYACTNLVKYNEVVYPKECLWINNRKAKAIVNDIPDKFCQLPTQVTENPKEIMEAHSESEIFSKINIRLEDIEINEERNKLILHTSRK